MFRTGATALPTTRIVDPSHPQGFVIINATDFDAATMVEHDPAHEHDAEPSLPDAPEDLASLGYQELRERAKALGLPTRGTKADLQAALLEHAAASAPDALSAVDPAVVLKTGATE